MERKNFENQNTINAEYQLKLEQQLEYIKSSLHHHDLAKAGSLLLDLHYADLADFLDNLNNKEYKNIFPAIAHRLNPYVLLSLSDANKQPAIEALGIKNSVSIIEELNIEDCIDIIEAVNSNLKKQILEALKPERKQQIIEGFKYPENTAGRVLEKDFVSLKHHWTVGQAMDYIRRSPINVDFHAAIITDNFFKPLGTVLLSKLVKSPRTTLIADLMNEQFVIAELSTEIDEIAFLFKQYSLTIMPVVNRHGKLMGSISIDNMLYIIEEKTESEILNLGGVNNSDIFYNLYISAKNRFPWLFINLITACLTSMVIKQFDDTISKLVTLAVVMPTVASMGGNAGTQAMTVTVRAISNREINTANSFRVITKEIYTCMLNGLMLSIIGGTLIFIIYHDTYLSVVFGTSILINFTMAGFLGSFIPIILNQLDIDPAAASGVLLTACTDTIGFFVFLGLSYIFLV